MFWLKIICTINEKKYLIIRNTNFFAMIMLTNNHLERKKLYFDTIIYELYPFDINFT